MEKPLTQHINLQRPPLTLNEYEKTGGYQALHKALKTMAPQDITKLVQESDLKGRGVQVSIPA